MNLKSLKFPPLCAFLSLCALAGLAVSPASAQESTLDSTRKVVVQAVPSKAARIDNLHRVVAAKTPSGFEVPRYVSLKNGKTNGRAGPSSNHAIVWQYRREGLPVIIVAETEHWRKIRDLNGDESWVYKALLTGARHVIAITDTPITKRESADSPVIAIAEKQALLRLEDCTSGRCKVFSKDGLRGWVDETAVWGAKALF